MTKATVTTALLAMLAAGAGGCMKLDDAQPIQLETHVEDWRDEVIYQILVDRFANGDSGNDYNVDPTSLALETEAKIDAFNKLGRDLCGRWLDLAAAGR